MTMDTAGEIKRLLSMDEVARHYGFAPNRTGFMHCPFHTGDRDPSLKVYRDPGGGFCCFGCGAGGSVIDFVMRLFDISFPAAVVRLNADFSLGLIGRRPDPRAAERRRAKQRKEAAARALYAAEYGFRTAQYRRLWGARINEAPTNRDEPFDPEFAEALRILPALDYWFDTHPFPGGESY